MKRITRDMFLADVVSSYPDAQAIMFQAGLYNIGDSIGMSSETVESVCRAHGMSEIEMENVVDRINEGLRFIPFADKGRPVKDEKSRLILEED